MMKTTDADLAGLFRDHIAELDRRMGHALERSGHDAALIFGGALRYRFLDDHPYPFTANPHFQHWVPAADNPDCLLLVRPGRRGRLYFHRPVDFWHKVAAAPSGFWADAFEIDFVTSLAETRPPVDLAAGRTAFIGEWDARLAPWGQPVVNPQPLLDCLHYHRAAKTAYEIECIRHANIRAAAGHQAAEQAFRAGASEFEIHLAYCRAGGQTERELPYGNIIALNEHGATLHYQALDRVAPAERHSFLIDAGASWHGYAADITRTYAARDDEFRALVAAMDAAQRRLCAAVRSGTDYKALQRTAHGEIAALLAGFGLVKLSADAIVETGISRAFFPHGLGHYLGIQVHDVGGFMADESGTPIPRPDDQPFLRLTRVLQPGQVLTIEPGLYFIDSLLAELAAGANARHVDWNRVDALRRYGGVRIEDNVVVTAADPVNLTRAAFAEVADNAAQ